MIDFVIDIFADILDFFVDVWINKIIVKFKKSK